jgi:hypothetical protein
MHACQELKFAELVQNRFTSRVKSSRDGGIAAKDLACVCQGNILESFATRFNLSAGPDGKDFPQVSNCRVFRDVGPAAESFRYIGVGSMGTDKAANAIFPSFSRQCRIRFALAELVLRLTVHSVTPGCYSSMYEQTTSSKPSSDDVLGFLLRNFLPNLAQALRTRQDWVQ